MGDGKVSSGVWADALTGKALASTPGSRAKWIGHDVEMEKEKAERLPAELECGDARDAG